MKNMRIQIFLLSAVVGLSGSVMAYGGSLTTIQKANYICHTQMSDLNLEISLEQFQVKGFAPSERLIDYQFSEIVTNSRKSAEGIFDLDNKPISKLVSDTVMQAQSPSPKSWLPDGNFIMAGGNDIFQGSVLQQNLPLDTQFPDLRSQQFETRSFMYLTFDHEDGIGSGNVTLRYNTSVQFEKTSATTARISLLVRAGDSSFDDEGYKFYGLKALPVDQQLVHLEGNCEVISKP